MPRVRIDNLGAFGVNRDLPASSLPPEVWTHLQNARVSEGGCEKAYGSVRTLGTDSTPLAIQPYWAGFAQNATDAYWLLMGANKVYAQAATSPFTQTNVTRQSVGVDVDYSATETEGWTGAMYGGIYIANNAVDVPQMWSVLSPSTKLANLSNWDTNRRCKSLRAYDRFLIALNLTISGNPFPHDVLWSHPADGGSVPISWDEADVTRDAGRYSLSDSQGLIVDGLQLRDRFIIYKEDAVWGMKWIGGTFVMQFGRVLDQAGLMSKNCVAAFKDNAEMHFAVGTDDVYIHNGQNAQSILNKRLRRWLFNAIDGTYFERSFVVAYPPRQEIWFCFPESGEQACTQALIWNWVDNKFSQRDLYKISSSGATRNTTATKGTLCIAGGLVAGDTLASWDAASGTWATETAAWDERGYSPLNVQLVGFERSGSKYAYVEDNGTQLDGTNYNVVMERTSLSIIGRDREGNPKNDNEVVKLLTELWPRFEGDAGTVINIEIGTQMSPNSAINWGTPYTFTIGTQKKINPYKSGKFLSVRFSWSSEKWARLINYEMQIEPAGTY